LDDEKTLRLFVKSLLKETPVDNDDLHVGRILTRREILSLMGITGAAVLAACTAEGLPTTPPATGTAAPTGIPATAEATAAASEAASAATAAPVCVVRPELTEGPYFVDVQLDRSDIRSDPGGAAARDGLQLELAFAVSRIEAGGCVPFEGALVDVWHCDADGLYSGVADRFGDTTGQAWLRGYQVAGADGIAWFTTIYPGWYEGRAVHIHFKIRTDAAAEQGLEFTSQLFFDDAISDEVYAFEPYVGNGERGTRNANDGIFGQSGNQLTLALAGNPQTGYTTTFEIGIDMS
jgi:protocatechuate 3,4-dioxygenase beta subunit